MDAAEASHGSIKLPVQSVERGLRFGCGYARCKRLSAAIQLPSTPEGEAADRYTKVRGRLHTKSKVRPILQSPRRFSEGEVAEGYLQPLENRV